MLMIQQLLNALTLSGVYALVAVSFTLGIGILNFLNFTIQAMFMLSGMVIWALMRAGLPWPVAAACGVATAAVAQLVVERFTYRYFASKHGDATEHALPLVSSLGFLIVFQNLALIMWGTDPQSLTSPFGDTNIRLSGLVVSLSQLASLLVAVLFVVVIKAVLDFTSLGRGLRCVAENRSAAGLMGVEVHRLVPIVFATAGVVAGIAGVLFALSYQQVSPRIGDEIGTKAIAAMVIGGMGSIWGAVAGGVLVGTIEVLSINYFDAGKVNAIVWGTLLAILCVRPTGLFGRAAFGKGKF